MDQNIFYSNSWSFIVSSLL